MNTDILDKYDDLCKRSRECHHILKCAVTPEERQEAGEFLRASREEGDERGVILALGRLSGPCTRL